jgi:hypothetical protein
MHPLCNVHRAKILKNVHLSIANLDTTVAKKLSEAFLDVSGDVD